MFRGDGHLLTDSPGARHDYLHNMDKTVLGILRADDAVPELIKDGPGRPGAVKRPQRFPQ